MKNFLITSVSATVLLLCIFRDVPAQTKNFSVLDEEIRISDMGPDGDQNFGTFTSEVAYNSAANEFLAVWRGNDEDFPEAAIVGQRIDATTGAEVGTNDFRISQTLAGFESGIFPAVAYNSTDNQYLVVWQTFEFGGVFDAEIFGQILDAEGNEIGADFQISQMETTPGLKAIFNAQAPKVAYNAINNEYLVVWFGDAESAVLVDNEFEIYGQRLDAAGSPVGDDDFRISQVGGDGNPSQTARNPAVVHNPDRNEYFVVWSGNHITTIGGYEREIYGQRLSAETGAEIGSNDFRISTAGPSGDFLFSAQFPSVAYNPEAGEYLVIWSADGSDALVDNETEVFGQRINATTEDQVGENDFRISDMGPDGQASLGVLISDVAYNAASGEYLAVWTGDDDTDPLVDDEFEVFGQRLDGATGAEVGDNDFRISRVGPDGNTDFFLNSVSLALNATDNRALVVWDGSNTIGDSFTQEFEVFGAFFDASADITLPVCGDGTLETGEECDDGNTADGDGCSAACVDEDSDSVDNSSGGCSLIRE